ncbi:mitotic checkpoint serine/threonine-protein kinase BUB1 [Odontesthes bonariensis]|uniref:mitotic checkpoint serine/threonine-protein kinase BUB1 n=1 Tax=Odontesthes bonariensis TaxID=219752 RepID=UPI003F5900CA
MDIRTYLQCFEDSLTSYAGDDPLDPWDKFVEFLEQRLPADSGGGMSLVFDSLVQRFLNVERYADDVRYINHCIKCARYHSDPVALYSHIFSKGVGTRTAALYVALAQQFEQKGMNDQADAVYQKALGNQAQPADTVLHEYRQFQTRTRSQLPVAGGRSPLQNSHLTNQMPSQRETVEQNKMSVDCPSKPPAHRMTIIVSRSETSGTLPSGQSSGVQTVSEYMTEELLCEDSEFCFEEVRARKYLRLLQEKEQRERTERKLREQEEQVQKLKSLMEQINQKLEVCGDPASRTSSQLPPGAQRSSDALQTSCGRPRPSNHLSSRRSLGLRLHTEPAFVQEAAAFSDAPQQHGDGIAEGSEVSHHPSVLPDGSAGFPKSGGASASVLQDSVVQPGGFQQTDPALIRPACFSAANADVVFQDAGVQHGSLDATHHDGSQSAEEKLEVSQGATANLSHITPNSSLGFVQATPSRVLPSPTVNTREALGVIMDMFQAPTLLDDMFSSTSQLHAAEKDLYLERSEGVFSLTNAAAAAPFTIFQDDNDKENLSAAPSAADSLKPVRTLAELAVQKTEKPNDTPPDLIPDESTMWGARFNSLNSLAACPNSTTDFALLAQFVSTPFTHKTPFNGSFFPDPEINCDGGDADNNDFISRQTKKLSPIMEQSPSDDKGSETAVSQLGLSSARQGTIVGEGLASAQHCLTTSSITMVQPPPPAVLSFRDQTFRDQTFCPADSPRAAGPSWEVYTSPEQPPKPAPLSPGGRETEAFQILEDLDRPEEEFCDVPMSPECALKPDWLTVRSPEATAEPDLDAFLSPCRLRRSAAAFSDAPMSPEQPDVSMSEPTASPDVSMSAEPARLVSDPWDNELISDLLSTVSPPLTAHPRCISWPCSVPAISPKMTISMGKASLRIDCVLGEGAFATVYQVTDPMTSERKVLKVQKPANPWEFYIHTQLDARLQPAVRRLCSSVHSAHLFHNGSALLGELHNYGTLLNAVNIYKTLSDKVMPQPLVLYFTICILHTVERLHAARIIHADIKPDNFMLGERFLDNKCFDSESVDHGLVLIDLGQSIDMELFPEGTAFTAKCLTSGFQCTEMLSGKPWSYQTDYFGIAGTVYCMLFGTYMQVTNEGGVWKTNGVFRRNPHSDLWLEFFHTLLNVPDGGSPASLHSLRCQLASVLQHDYSSKLPSLKSRLVVLLLENRKAGRR